MHTRLKNSVGIFIILFLQCATSSIQSVKAADDSKISSENTVEKKSSKKIDEEKKISGQNAKTSPTFTAMQSKYKNVATLRADFTQSIKNLTLGSTKTSSGQIFIKRPDKFRWQTVDPEPSILVGNAHKVWYYTPPFRDGEKGQVLTRKATDVQSRLALDLLSGHSNTEKDFKIKPLAADHFELIPLKPAGDVARIELFLERPTNLVYKLMLFTKTGNQTELVLKNVTLSPKLGDDMFTFVPPANTEEIR
mgnify:CR=1 FL=1